MLEHIVENHIDKMPYWKLSKLFYEILNLKKPLNESNIQRIKNRRNELIHNNLEVNFKCNTIYPDNIGVLYLEECLNEYEKYLIEIKTNISKVYANYSKLNLLKNLWHYTFKTPLCSNFDDFWYSDIQKDSIIGCKNPDMAKRLSSSERFMLEIWQS